MKYAAHGSLKIQDRKNHQKICHLGCTTLSAVCSQLRHVSTVRKKLVKQQYLLHMSAQYGELRLTSVCQFGAPQQISTVAHLAFVTVATLLTGGQPNFARCLAISCAGTLYIHFWGLLPPYGIFFPVQNSHYVHQSLAFSYIGNVTAWHSSSGPQPNFAAWCKEWNYRTFAQGTTYIRLGGHHVGHRPTF